MMEGLQGNCLIGTTSGVVSELPAHLRKAPLPTFAALERDRKTMAFGSALSATEYVLVFGPFAVMFLGVNVMPALHHGWCSKDSLRKVGGGLWLRAPLS